MTTFVTTLIGRTQSVVAAAPSSHLREFIDDTPGSFVAASGGDRVLLDIVPATTKCGTKPWVVFKRDETDLAQYVATQQIENDARFTAMEEQLTRLTQSTETLSVPFVRNAATQILLFCIGNQPHPNPSTAQYFHNLPKDPGTPFALALDALNATLPAPTTENYIASTFDAIIDRRTLHVRNVQQLKDDLVVPSLALLDRHPNLLLACRQEALVLRACDGLLSAFGRA
jgi:hypothetical protein